MTTETSNETQIQTEPSMPWGEIAIRIANDIAAENFNRGDLANLRRMDPDTPDAAVFYQLSAKYNLSGSFEMTRKWALVMHGIALMTQTSSEDATSRAAHVRSMSIGKALFTGGDDSRTSAFYSESRFNRLLTARGTMLRTLLARMFRMMAATSQGFDWYQMAQFVLYDGYDDERANQIRQNIARDYYWAENRANR